MMCGGRATWDNQADQWRANPLQWATAKNLVPPSYGRHILLSQLPARGWIRSNGDGSAATLQCPHCLRLPVQTNWLDAGPTSRGVSSQPDIAFENGASAGFLKFPQSDFF